VSGSPTIQWFGPDGSEITTGVSTTTLTSTLTLSDLSLSDAGQYTCRSTLSGVVREAVEGVLVQSESINGYGFWHMETPSNIYIQAKLISKYDAGSTTPILNGPHQTCIAQLHM